MAPIAMVEDPSLLHTPYPMETRSPGKLTT